MKRLNHKEHEEHKRKFNKGAVLALGCVLRTKTVKIAINFVADTVRNGTHSLRLQTLALKFHTSVTESVCFNLGVGHERR
jgi:hypothetical protein